MRSYSWRTSRGVGNFQTKIYNRLEKLTARLISTAIRNNHEFNLIPRKISCIQENASKRFVHHSNPQISTFLRSRKMRNLNEAFRMALTEEKALRLHRKRTTPTGTAKFCRNCNRKEHMSWECRQKRRYCTPYKTNTHGVEHCFRKGRMNQTTWSDGVLDSSLGSSCSPRNADGSVPSLNLRRMEFRTKYGML